MLADDLRQLISGEIADDAATRGIYSHDASIFEVVPQVIVFPRDSSEVQKVVRYAADHAGTAIVARGGGTDMGGGSIGQSIVMDFTQHLNTFVGIERETTMRGQDGHAVAQPGIWYRDFEKATLEQGMIMPTYPGSREICALGGMISNNAGGELSLRYGKTVDYVRSLRAVMADGNEYEFGPLGWPALQAKMAQQDWEGNLYRQIYDLIEKHYDVIQAAKPNVSKNSSGYYLWLVWDRTTFNLAKLLSGAQGTLGMITQATMGLIRPKPRKAMVVAFLRDLKPLASIVNELLALKPESIESFDNNTLSLTLRFLPDFIKRMGARNLLTLAWQFLPEAKMMLTGGLPKMILMVEFAGDDAPAVRARAREALAVLQKYPVKSHMTHDEQESHKYWVIRRESFNVLRSHTHGKRTTPFIDDFIIPPQSMPEFLPKLNAILDPYKLTLTIAGHAGNGNFHIIPLIDLRDEKTRKIIPEISEKVYDLVLQYKGSITAEHNDGLIRGPYVERQFGPQVYELFRQTKKIFDPKGIFNPGKKIDVDWQWALAHLRKD